MKITPWFCEDQMPARLGVYERDLTGVGVGRVYSFWNGGRWCMGGGTPEEAMLWIDYKSICSQAPWRGLAEPSA